MIDDRGIYTIGGHCPDPEVEAALALARARGYTLGQRLASAGYRTVGEAVGDLGGHLGATDGSTLQADVALFSRGNWFRIIVANPLTGRTLLPLAVGHALGILVLHHQCSLGTGPYPELAVGIKGATRWGYDQAAFEAQWFARAFAAAFLGQPWHFRNVRPAHS